MTTLFWVALVAYGLVAVGWIVYPFVMRLLGRHQRAIAPASDSPDVTVIVATREEPSVIVARVANLRDSDYPGRKLDIVIAVDAKSEHSLAAYEAAVGPDARVVVGDAPGGKACTLNAGARAATGALLVLADSHQRFDRRTIPELVAAFHDPLVGAASGAYSNRDPKAAPSVLDLFWEYERALRRAEAAVHSIVAVTGCNFALRRDLWQPLPAGLLCDDLLIPLDVAMAGRRVAFCEKAMAMDPRRFSRQQEFTRKVRTLTGMLQVCAWRPAVLSPWRNPIWVQFVCHKLLRLATPYLLIIGTIASTAAAASFLGWNVLADALVAVVLAGLTLAILRPLAARRLVQHAIWSLSLLASPIFAGANAVRGRWDVWQRH